MLESVPYALALMVTAGLFWDGHRARLAVMTKQLSVVLEFEQMKRDYELLKAQTKKAIEVQHAQLDESLKMMQAQINVEEMKRANALSGRRIG